MILVTGGTGYVGTVLVPLLAQRYPVRVYCNMAFGNAIEGTPNVEFIKGDLRDTQLMQFALRGVHQVVHLAGIVTSELVAMNEALSQQINVDAMAVLVRQARAANVHRFVYASSSSVYGFCEKPATEEMVPKPMDAYAQTKLDGEEALKREAGAMEWAILRSATLCGPAPRMRLDTIVNVFCKQAWFNGKITVFDGRQWRSNVHVRDAAEGYVWLLEQPEEKVNHAVFNLTVANMRALDIARLVQQAVEFGYERKALIAVDTEKIDRRHYQLDAARMRQAGFAPRHSIREAVFDTCDWFQAGGVREPDADVYSNTKRMATFMKES